MGTVNLFCSNRRHWLVLGSLFILFLPNRVLAQDTASIRLAGEILHPSKWTITSLAMLPRDSVSWEGHDSTLKVYTGVRIQTLLQSAGVPQGADLRGKGLTKYLLVTCRDGYKVIFSLAELDHSFTGLRVLLADHADGQFLPVQEGPFRLIVPGDQPGARSCRQVVLLQVASL